MSCQSCFEGFVIVCPDDMCRAAGECIHGDGEALCPDCEGDFEGFDCQDDLADSEGR